jgi:S1-C subfamily serine protease
MGLDSADFLLFSPAEPLPPSPLLGVMIEDGEEGLLVKGVSPHSPAMQAGIKENDVVVSLDGHPIKEVEDLKIALLYKNKGDTVRVEVKRARTFLPDSRLAIDIRL